MEKYPTVSLTELHKLKAIIVSAEGDPKYLDGRVCPYDKPTRELIKSLITDPILKATVAPREQEKVGRGAPRKGPVLPIEEVEAEYADLRKDLQSLKTDAKGLEPNEQIQVIKTRAALMEKMISLKERLNDMRRNTKFIATVMQIIEDELPQESRLRVIEKLQPFTEEE